MKKNTDRPQKPQVEEKLNLQRLDEAINDRLDVIEKEFTNGLNFIKNCSKSVTVFGSARTLENEKDYIVAREFGSRVVKDLDYAVITGGAGGIMEAANRGAHEVGGRSIGINIKLPHEQVTNPYLTDSMEFEYFFARKVTMSFSAEAYVYFPGGFGTLDELFEILTLIQTQKIDPTPIILFGKKYWKGLDKYIKKHLEKGEKISVGDRDLYYITDNIDEAIDIIRKAPIRTGIE